MMKRRTLSVLIGLVALSACGEPDDGTVGAPAPTVAPDPTGQSVPPAPSQTDPVDPNDGPFDPAATMQPDQMRAEPAVVGSGEEVFIHFPGGRERGVAYVLEQLHSDRWWTTHFMSAALPGTAGDPSWASFGEDGFGWEDIGVGGEGPDRLIIPPSALAGDYRICTANSVQNICTPVTIVKPEETAAPVITAPRRPALLEGYGVEEPVGELVGMPFSDFEEVIANRGLGPVRVGWSDGDYLVLTADLLPGRVNVAIETIEGVETVIEARVEVDPDSGAIGPEATVVGFYDGVEFYPACGNERLNHAGVLWSQVQPSEYPDLYERAVNGLREQAPEGVVVRGLMARVVAPGPGDDVGTLVVWSDDVAYFISDSGKLSTWLVAQELTYPWEC